MLRLKNIIYNTSFALNCLLLFLLIFESRIAVPAWLQAIGRMHTMILHFPIVLLLLAIIWELFCAGKKPVSAEKIAIGDALLLTTAFTSVISATMGLLLSKEEGYSEEVVAWHKWGGVLVSVLSLAWYAYREKIRQTKVVMMITAGISLVVILITGHLGGNITHGENFVLAPVTKEAQEPKVLFEDAMVYANMVQPILKSKCISCHNEKKAKGELIMETFASLVKGGKTGPLWDLNKPDLGLLFERLHLPLDNKKHMPPSGKPQLTPEEEMVLYHWIKTGASDKLKVTALPEGDTLRNIAVAKFNTIETDEYHFAAADEKKIQALKSNYRLVQPLAEGSPALGVTFFSASQFKPEQLKELNEVKDQIVSLNLNKMPVTDEDLATIAQFTNLRKLNLSFTNIKGSGLKSLATLKELKQLSLSGTGVNAASLAALAPLTKLTELHIWTTPAQSENLAALQKQLPHIQVQTGFKGDTITIKLNMPLIENEEQIVIDPIALKIKHPINGVSIRYTTDGSEPDSLKSPEFKNNVQIDKSITIKAKAFKPGWISSDIAEKIFLKAGYKVDSIWLLKASADEPYKSLSAKVMIDQQKGEGDFRSGKWMGYHGAPLEAVLYFEEPKNVSSITVSNLVDIGSYIMPPQQIEIWAGSDATNLHLIKKMNPEQPTMDAASYMKSYDLSFSPIKEKYFKVVVKPVMVLPQWHRGKGDKGWVFVDEVLVN